MTSSPNLQMAITLLGEIAIWTGNQKLIEKAFALADANLEAKFSEQEQLVTANVRFEDPFSVPLNAAWRAVSEGIEAGHDHIQIARAVLEAAHAAEVAQADEA